MFFDQIPFFAITKMAKNQFLNWDNYQKCNFTKKNNWFIWFYQVFCLDFFIFSGPLWYLFRQYPCLSFRYCSISMQVNGDEWIIRCHRCVAIYEWVVDLEKQESIVLLCSAGTFLASFSHCLFAELLYLIYI